MSQVTIEQRVKAIIVQELGVNPEQVTPDARLVEDLGVDSIDAIQLIMAAEEEFEFAIDDDAAERLATVEDCVRYITENGGR